MKRALLVIVLSVFVASVACHQTETAKSLNANSAPASDAGSGNTNTAAATDKANTNQTNNASPQADDLLLPRPVGFVSDFAKVVDEPTSKRLEATLNKLKQRAGIEFVVVIVETTGKEDLDAYSLSLAQSWGIGATAGGDGLLLMVAVRDHKWRIQVSRSLEADMPDDVVGELGGLMNEPFRAGKYGEGLTKCVDAIIARLGKRRGFETGMRDEG